MTSEVHGHPNAGPVEPAAEFGEPPSPWPGPDHKPYERRASPAVPPQQYAPPPAFDKRAKSAEARVTGTAHVPEVALLPAHQLPPLPNPVPRLYGRPTPESPIPPAVAHDAAPPAGYGAPAPAARPPATPPPPAPPPPAPAPHAPAPAAPFAAAVPPGPYQPPAAESQWPGQATSAPGGPYPAGPGDGGTPFGPRPVGTASPVRPAEADGHTPPTQGGDSHTGMLIAVGGVVLLAVVALIAFMWPSADPNPQFAVGSCVKKSQEIAVPAECTAAGAFKITDQVERKEQCVDQVQPYVELGAGKKRVLCLAPATGGETPPETASAEPTASS